jgi:tetratricopeptide (TPR) repeat protein
MPTKKSDTNSNRRLYIFICLFLVIATAVVYWQVRHHDFVSFDDGLYVYENQHVQAGLTREGVKWAFGFTDIAYWHPVTWLSHMLDCQLFGLDAGKHHLTNLFFHLANSLLLFFIGVRMTGHFGPSAFMAAMFAIHPINVESVAWVAERKNVLSTFFWMLTLLSYSYYAQKPAWGKYILTLLTFALGLMVKPALVTLPFVLLLLDFWPLRRLLMASLNPKGHRPDVMHGPSRTNTASLWMLLLEKIPFLALTGVSIALAMVSVQHHGIVISANTIPLHLRMSNALITYMTYIGKLVWPSNLAVFYPYPQAISIGFTIAAVIWLACVSIITLRFCKKMPFLMVGWLWYLGTLIPHVGFVQAGIWPAMADRWAYVPFIGLLIMIVGAAYELWSRFQSARVGLAVLGGIMIMMLGTLAWIQVGYWSTSIDLYQHAVDVTDNNDVAHNNLGAAFFNAGKVDKAIFHFVEAMRIMPGLAAAHANLNKTFGAHENIDNAIAEMQRLIALYPNLPALQYNLGNLYRDKGEFDRAIYYYEKALVYKPDFIQAINNLAGIYVMRADDLRALVLLKRIIELEQDATDVYYMIACIYSKQQKVADAGNWLRLAVEHGFKDWDHIRSDPKLENIRDSVTYKQLLQGD